MQNKVIPSYKTIGKLILTGALIVGLAVQSADTSEKTKSVMENVRIQLPDGLYMYDSSIQHLQNGGIWVGFGKYFVVKNNTIYSSQAAVKKFGVKKINSQLAENKKYKILLGGEKIGEIHDVKIDNDEDWDYKENLLTNNIKEGPMYKVESIYIDRLGSVSKFMGVPVKYKEVRNIYFPKISKEQLEKITKLVENKLFNLVKKRKEIKQLKMMDKNLYEEKIDLLDKISDRSGEMFIGIYRYVFKTIQSGVYEFEIAFVIKNDTVHVITSNFDNVTLAEGEINLCGMLDVDNCGENELMIEKNYGGLNGVTTNLEMYKQKVDGTWIQIKKIKMRRSL
jgi:hypothetical protein